MIHMTFTNSDGLDPDQDRHSAGLDLGPHCLQMLSTDASNKDIYKGTCTPISIPYILLVIYKGSCTPKSIPCILLDIYKGSCTPISIPYILLDIYKGSCTPIFRPYILLDI